MYISPGVYRKYGTILSLDRFLSVEGEERGRTEPASFRTEVP